PQADAKPMEEDAKRPLVVSVDREGQYHITYDDDRTQAVDGEELLRQAGAIITANPGIPVLVKGDRAVDYGQVIQAMVLLQQAGAPNIGLLTDPTE
ncbi:ExbD/TolR family protein, partial [Thiolapillus sp.]